jgi:Myotubularin-like phosphatase domain
MSGFEELIDREWVALGHQFYDRYTTASAEKVKLLFYGYI